jgi:type II restriction enzyme
MRKRGRALQLDCDTSVADLYKSASQRARVISEAWFRSFGYCLSCDSNRLVQTAANTRARDFLCPDCSQAYELKASAGKLGRTLPDGAYSALISRVQDGQAPTLMLLERSSLWAVKSLTAIHGQFLTPEVIVKRKPLSPDARRAGWIGCSIRLDLMAPDAQIPVVSDGKCLEPAKVRQTFQRFNKLGALNVGMRGWVLLTLRVIRSLGVSNFSLDAIYGQEAKFAAVYPMNRNIRAKIRQQLQVLRDLGYVEFRGNGRYRFLI